MNTFLFNPDYMAKYYNCSGRTYEEWKALGQPNVLLGFVYGFSGLIFMIILLPFMVVFIKSDLMQYSCYKIMFFIGIIDCLELPIGGFYSGYAAAVGMVYCMAPTVNYICGSLGLSCWYGGSMTCILLAINRCIDVMNPQLGHQLFSGKRTLIWLLFPIAYFFYCFFFHTPIIFSPTLYAFFFDPFVGTPERHGLVDSEHYPHIVQSIHNIVVVVSLLVAYSFLFIHIYIKAAKSDDRIRMSKIQRQIFLQCIVVCAGTLVSSMIYVYMQLLPTPVWIVIFAEITWQFSHGAAGISYAFFNPTMRKELVKIFCSSVKIAPNAAIPNNKASIPTTDQQGGLGY